MREVRAVSLHNLLLQFSFLFAPMTHMPTEQICPTIYRGRDPNIAQIKVLHDKGIKTIVSLRTHDQPKKQKYAESLGMKWVRIPSGVFKTPAFAEIDAFRGVVNKPANQPCYVCCTIGTDRNAAFLAAYRMTDENWTAQQTLTELEQHHLKRWWPIFADYPKTAAAYAKTHQSTTDTETASSGGATTATTTVSASTTASTTPKE
jgi:protein tyrosine phosphatase (PTP) superfamily phosphohydrolase (DUF442 family)